MSSAVTPSPPVPAMVETLIVGLPPARGLSPHSASSQDTWRNDQTNKYSGVSVPTMIRPDIQSPCRFCMRNEPGNWTVYMSHPVRDSKDRVVCPQLRSYVCPNCGATGDRAHTRAYCPLGPPVKSVVAALKQTYRLGDGRMRK